MSIFNEVLADLPLGSIRSLERIDSTNEEAWRWIQDGAPDMAIIIAEEQTAGRGRMGRRWYTAPGASLAFSIIIKKIFIHEGNTQPISHLTAMGALAVCEALGDLYGMEAEIKWPNDVLVKRKKIAGVLVEMHWLGNRLSAAVLGIGINVAPASVPPRTGVLFPAACIEDFLEGRQADRCQLLYAVLRQVLSWRSNLGTTAFLHKWESYLAFRNEWVCLSREAGYPVLGEEASLEEVKLIGLNEDGSLRVCDRFRKTDHLHMGEIHFRLP